MSNPPNPLFLPTTADELSNSQSSRQALTSQQLKHIKHLLNGARTPSMPSSTTSVKGRRVLVPVTSKALFEATLQPQTTVSDVSSEEQFVVHVGGGRFEEMGESQARALFDAQLMKFAGNSSTASDEKKLQAKKSGKYEPVKSVLKSKPVQPLAAPTDGELPLMEIREEWNASNTGMIRSEVVNISKQMQRLNAGLKHSEDTSDGKQFGEMLVNLLKGREDDSQSIDIDVSSSPTDAVSLRSEMKAETKSTALSDEEYDAIYSRLEELEKLEEESMNTQKPSSKSSQSGWSKGFLNAKPKKKQSAPKQHTINSRQDDCDMKGDMKVPMKQPAPNDAEGNSKPSKISFSQDVNIKEISPRATATGVEPNYFKKHQELDPFPTVETVPFEENVFRGVVKERIAANVASEKNAVPNQGGEKKLSRFAMRRLERGLG